MIGLIMGCALIGTVLLIALCGPLSAASIPVDPPRVDIPSIVTEESFRDGWQFGPTQERRASHERMEEDAIRTDLRERIASSSVQILRSRGMSDEEIKSELLRDFFLTEEQVDKILETQ